jgi:hypothetical protein
VEKGETYKTPKNMFAKSWKAPICERRGQWRFEEDEGKTRKSRKRTQAIELESYAAN